jgi:PAS domain S-box-containing protein
LHFTSVNKAACERLGYSEHELLGLGLNDIVAADHLQQVLELGDMLKQNANMIFESVHVAKDGRHIPIEVNARMIKIGKQRLRMSVARDITDRKISENKSLEITEMLQSVLDTIPQSICWKDCKSVFLGCNMNFARMVGLDNPQKIIGKTDWDLPWKKEETEFFIACDKRIMNADSSEYHIIETALNSLG